MELTNITKASGIYCIESISNGKKYIGSAVSLKHRAGTHLYALRSCKHGNQRLQNHFNKYGEDDLVFTVIEEGDKSNLISREQHYIDTIKPEFNICKIAGSSLGRMHSEEAKKNMSITRKGREMGEATRQAIRIANTGHIHSEEHKKKLSIAHTGKVMSDEHKRKMSIARTGMVMSEEYKKMMSIALSGENNYWYGRYGESAATSKRVLCIETGEVFGSSREAQGIMFPDTNKNCVASLANPDNPWKTHKGYSFIYITKEEYDQLKPNNKLTH